MDRVRHSRRYVAAGIKNAQTIKTLGVEGTERSGAHNGHNHPSGVAEPSEADRNITVKLAKALALVEIRLLDHLVVSRGGHVSLAERGLI